MKVYFPDELGVVEVEWLEEIRKVPLQVVDKLFSFAATHEGAERSNLSGVGMSEAAKTRERQRLLPCPEGWSAFPVVERFAHMFWKMEGTVNLHCSYYSFFVSLQMAPTFGFYLVRRTDYGAGIECQAMAMLKVKPKGQVSRDLAPKLALLKKQCEEQIEVWQGYKKDIEAMGSDSVS